MVRNLRDGALTRYEHFEKIKEKLSLKYCVLPERRQKKKIYMHVAYTYYATIKGIHTYYATIKGISQIKHQLDATLCKFYFCRVTLQK